MKLLTKNDFDVVHEQRVEWVIRAAQERLCDNDSSLLRHDAHERSICFRLAVYLEELFPDFDVDCEYNRNHNDERYQKRLHDEGFFEIIGHQSRLGEEDGLIILPDIIVHIRDEPMNLLVIEAKKTSSVTPEHRDLYKLKAIKQDLGYRYARFIKFNVGDDFDRGGICESFFI